MRRSPLEEGRRWLDQAEEDLRWAKDLAERGGYHIACFLSQQVGEKAIKAFIYAGGEEIVIGHSIERLCRAAGQRRPLFNEKVAIWSILDSYYIPTRYPNGLPDSIPARVYNQTAAREAVRLADEIVSLVRSELTEQEKASSGKDAVSGNSTQDQSGQREE